MRSDRIGLFCVRASVAAAGILWFAAEAPAQFPTTGPGRGGSGGGNYSADGDVWVRVVRNSTGGRTVTTHNANTRIQEVVTYNHLNRVVLKRTYQLNRYDQPERFLVYDARGAVVYRGEFEYDLQDRLSEERLFSMPGDFLVRRLV